MYLIIRAKLEGKDPEKGLLYESIPSKIKALINKNSQMYFDFVIGELEDDPKKAKKSKYKNQKSVNTKNVKGEKYLLQMKNGDIIVKIDNQGYPTIDETNENFLHTFSDFINEAKNIKKNELFGYSVKTYCTGKDIEIQCEKRKDAEELVKKFKKYYESVYLSTINKEDLIIKISLLPSEILKLFLEKYG